MTDKNDAIFFDSPAAFRAWLEEHAATEPELWVGLHRKATGKPTLAWAKAVDEALCFGWIDGKAGRLDEERWALRFTPRRPTSNWSAVNVRRVPELIAEGRMTPAGLRAFELRDPTKTPYSYETASTPLDPAFEARLQAHEAAWADWSARSPSYRRGAAHWVMSAKQEATRERRMAELIDDSAAGRLIKPARYGSRP